MAKAPSRFRRWLPRYSLGTLVLVVMLIGSGTTLWWRWAPWYIKRLLQIYDAHMGSLLRTIPEDSENLSMCEFSPDSKYLLLQYPHMSDDLAVIGLLSVDSG